MKGYVEKKSQVTLDLMSDSPFLFKERKRSWPGESCSLSNVTWGLFPCIHSNVNGKNNILILKHDNK